MSKIGGGNFFFIEQLIRLCDRTTNTLCLTKVTNVLFKITQEMKNLQKLSKSILTIIGKRNNTQNSRCMKKFLLPTFMDSIN